MPPALPTSTTGASTMLMPEPAEVGAAIGGRRLDRLDGLPGQVGRAGQLAEHVLQRLHAAALVVHRHEQRQVVAERGDQGAVLPDRGAAADEHAAGPRRALEQRQHRRRASSPSTPIMSVMASRDRSGKASVVAAQVRGLGAGRIVAGGVVPVRRAGSRTRAGRRGG